MSRFLPPILVATVVALLVQIAAAFSGGSSAIAQDDNLRCGSRLIAVGMAASQVKEICGEPRSTRVEQVPVYARNPAGTGVRQTGTTQVETWIYDRGATQFPARLKFEEGKLVSIELVRPGEDADEDD